MKSMIIGRSVNLFAILAVTIGFLTPAHAAKVIFNPGMTAATGISGLEVGGTVYDVDFTGSISHNNWATMLDVTTLAEATIVLEAIAAELDAAAVTLIEYDLSSGGTFEHTGAALFYTTTATSLLGVSITAANGWSFFTGGSTAPLNNSSPFAVDLAVALADVDSDGVSDTADNCTEIANADQRDTNGDNIGNRCDPDFDNDCDVDFFDVGIIKDLFLTADPDADLDGDGFVGFLDLGIVKEFFLAQPGPSAAGCN